jgi:hypothetical protein
MHQNLDNPIKFMRLNTGEDIISEVVLVKNEGNFYLCINPLKIVYNLAARPDSLIVAFSPWVFSSICDKQEFPIFPSDVLTIADPTKALVDCYRTFINKMEKVNLETKIDKVDNDEFNHLEDEITQEEQEFLKSVLENLEKGKRKLH